MSDLLQELTDILEERKRGNTLKFALSSAQGFLTKSKSLLKEMSAAQDGLLKTNAVVELQLQNAAYRYAFEYKIAPESREKFQQRYEEALQALRMGHNPYWVIIDNVDFVDYLENVSKSLRKTKRNRTKLTIDEIDGHIAKFEGAIEELKSVVQKLEKQRPVAVDIEAEKQGLE